MIDGSSLASAPGMRCIHPRRRRPQGRCSTARSDTKTASIADRRVLDIPEEDGILPEGFSPADSDIVCGRGRSYAKHIGNMSFKGAIRANAERYMNAQRRIDKILVVDSVVDDLLENGCRFVKRDCTTKRWHQMGQAYVHEKTGHALRDLLKEQERRTSSGSRNTTRTSTIVDKNPPKIQADEITNLDDGAMLGRRSTHEPIVNLSHMIDGIDYDSDVPTTTGVPTIEGANDFDNLFELLFPHEKGNLEHDIVSYNCVD